jgi:hypothetical protein
MAPTQRRHVPPHAARQFRGCEQDGDDDESGEQAAGGDDERRNALLGWPVLGNDGAAPGEPGQQHEQTDDDEDRSSANAIQLGALLSVAT